MIGIVCAMQCEADVFLELFDEKNTQVKCGRTYVLGKIGTQDCVLTVSDVGKVNAATACEALLHSFDVSMVMNGGICGASDITLSVGDSVIVSDAVQYDFDISFVDDCPLGKIPNMNSEFITPIPTPITEQAKALFPCVRCATGDRFTNDEQDIVLVHSLNASAREMETAAIFQVCEIHKMPILSVKSISDVIGKDDAKSYYENKATALAALKVTLEKVFGLFVTLEA